MPLWEQELVDDIQDQQVFVRNSARKKTTEIPQHKELLQRRQSEELLKQDFICKSTSASSRANTSSAQRKREDSNCYLNMKEPLQSAGSGMKGRIGYLRRAVADAHRKTSSAGKPGVMNSGQKAAHYQAVDIEVYSCDKCDRMFCHADELQEHCSSCTN